MIIRFPPTKMDDRRRLRRKLKRSTVGHGSSAYIIIFFWRGSVAGKCAHVFSVIHRTPYHRSVEETRVAVGKGSENPPATASLAWHTAAVDDAGDPIEAAGPIAGPL